jgi:hypothetical protein
MASVGVSRMVPVRKVEAASRRFIRSSFVIVNMREKLSSFDAMDQISLPATAFNDLNAFRFLVAKT